MRNNHLMAYSDWEIAFFEEKSLKNVKYLKFWSYPIKTWSLNSRQVIEAIQYFTKKWVECYIWWGIFDSAKDYDDIKKIAQILKTLWIETIEITNSEDIFMDPVFFKETINILKWEFDKVLIEIWTKHRSRFCKDYKQREKAIENAVKADADEIIIEWWIWKVWIYTEDYKLKTLLLINIIKKIYELWYKDKYIVESSFPSHQVDITQKFWKNITLWNIRSRFYDFIDSLRTWILNNKELAKIKEIYTKAWINNNFNIKNNNQNNNSVEDLFQLIEILFELAKEYKIDPNLIFFDENFYNLDDNIETNTDKIRNKIINLSLK